MIDAAIIGARFLQFVAAMVLFGSALFYFYGLPPKQREITRLKRCISAAYVVALIAAPAWILLQAAMLAEPSDALDPAFLGVVLLDTSLGRAFVIRFAVLIAGLICFQRMDAQHERFWRIQAVLCGVLLGSLAWFGHGAEGQPYGVVH